MSEYQRGTPLGVVVNRAEWGRKCFAACRNRFRFAIVDSEHERIPRAHEAYGRGLLLGKSYLLGVHIKGRLQLGREPSLLQELVDRGGTLDRIRNAGRESCVY